MKPIPDPSNSSFRDPSGQVFIQEGVVLRTVQNKYGPHYNHLIQSGLYDKLVQEELLIPHEEIEFDKEVYPDTYKLLRPTPIPFISYAYEWSFSQLKDAALAIIGIQKTALEYKMILKDSPASNIQWLQGKPVLIDTLSFENYQEGQPWIAYRQFCQHFLAPLALMSYCDLRSNLLLLNYPDGIPLDMARSFLPLKSKLNTHIGLHIHWHGATRSSNKNNVSSAKFSLSSFKGLIASLESTINALHVNKKSSKWNNYYSETILGKEYLENKEKLAEEFLSLTTGTYVWDLGANTGLFSRMAAKKASLVVSFDHDPMVVEENYLNTIKNGEKNILPIFMDLTHPTPEVGWNLKERFSLLQRSLPDVTMALALTHHLCISNNIPLKMLRDFFSQLGEWLVIEFIPKTDPKVKVLLQFREDIFENYNEPNFEKVFGVAFTITKKAKVDGSERTLYLMQKKS